MSDMIQFSFRVEAELKDGYFSACKNELMPPSVALRRQMKDYINRGEAVFQAVTPSPESKSSNEDSAEARLTQAEIDKYKETIRTLEEENKRLQDMPDLKGKRTEDEKEIVKILRKEAQVRDIDVWDWYIELREKAKGDDNSITETEKQIIEKIRQISCKMKDDPNVDEKYKGSSAGAYNYIRAMAEKGFNSDLTDVELEVIEELREDVETMQEVGDEWDAMKLWEKLNDESEMYYAIKKEAGLTETDIKWVLDLKKEASEYGQSFGSYCSAVKRAYDYEQSSIPDNLIPDGYHKIKGKK